MSVVTDKAAVMSILVVLVCTQNTVASGVVRMLGPLVIAVNIVAVTIKAIDQT